MATVEIRYCSAGNHFTLQKKCHETATDSVLPAKYSPQDTYGKYRRAARKEVLQKEGVW